MSYACANVICSQYGCQGHCLTPWERPFHHGFGTPLQPTPIIPFAPGCICPPTSEQTCQSAACPRKAMTGAKDVPA